MTTAETPCEWYEVPDIVRRVLGSLTTLQDVLTCDLVCKGWYRLQVPVPAAVTICATSPQQAAWLQRNTHRVLHVTLEANYTSDDVNEELLKSLCHRENRINSLVLRNCPQLTQLPPCIGQLSQLQTLQVLNCTHLKELPETLNSLSALQHLEVSAAPATAHDAATHPAAQNGIMMASAAPNHSANGSLEPPEAAADLFNFSSLAGYGHCCALRVLPDSIGRLVNLRVLILRNCPFLQHITESIGRLSCLTQVSSWWSLTVIVCITAPQV